jgi:hypothetical protein
MSIRTKAIGVVPGQTLSQLPQPSKGYTPIGDDMENVQAPETTSELSPLNADAGKPPLPVVLGFFSHHRFICLFIALLLFFVLVPLTHQFRDQLHPGILISFETIMFVTVIGGVVLSISRTRAWKGITLALALPAVALWMIHIAVPSRPLEVIRYLVVGGFIGYAIVLMLIAVFTARKVTFNVLCACLCAYLLLGIVWALGYSLLSVLDLNSFRQSVPEPGPARLRVGPDATMEAMYFSFATLTTLGYGDIVPTAPFARAMACLEALVGQLYLAVLVARLVGLHILHAMEQTATGQKQT